jgi:hypothetical protein
MSVLFMVSIIFQSLAFPCNKIQGKWCCALFSDSHKVKRRKVQNHFQSTCPICLEAISEGHLVSWSQRLPNCRHVFHKDCIQKWLDSSHYGCPCCRGDLDINLIELATSLRRNIHARMEEYVNLPILEHRKKAQFCVNHGLILPPS